MKIDEYDLKRQLHEILTLFINGIYEPLSYVCLEIFSSLVNKSLRYFN
jgi:hypothetical protein